MPDQRVRVHLNVPADPRRITQLLEHEGLTVEELTEVRGGVFNTVDVVSFIVERLDDAVIGVLAGVVANWVSKAPDTITKRGVNFSIKKKTGGDMFIFKVKGDGNVIQLHPKPEPDEEE